MTTQIAILLDEPAPDRLSRVRNAPGYRGEGIEAWLRKQYRGNKPTGGLWTSSHTPDDKYESDWARGMATNALIRHAFPINPRAKSHRLMVDATAQVLEISSLDAALEFTERFRISRVAIPERLMAAMPITAEITDWEKAVREYAGIHLTADGCDAVLHARMEGLTDTAFVTWNAESTLWGRWAFRIPTPL